MRTRKLVLRTERLSELSNGELGSVAGGVQTRYCPTNYCIPSWYVTCRISEVLADCPSAPVC